MLGDGCGLPRVDVGGLDLAALAVGYSQCISASVAAVLAVWGTAGVTVLFLLNKKLVFVSLVRGS